MANTYTLIASQTLASSATTVTFSSIPQTYTDLCLRISARTNSSTTYEYMYINFNNTGYASTVRYMQGGGTGTLNSGLDSATGYIGINNGNTSTANIFGNSEVYIPNYAGSAYKSYSTNGTQENNATASYMHFLAGLWSNTAAINQIAIQAGNTQSFLQYTTMYLYGIKNA
jgi:hypothetical protein